MKSILIASLLAAVSLNAVHAQTAREIRKTNRAKKVPKIETGVASFYSAKFKGKLTASGERYDPAKLTAAHNRLRMGSRIKVTNLRNQHYVIVVVNDRLNYRNKRLVDLSHAAAKKLGFTGRGIARVRVETLSD